MSFVELKSLLLEILSILRDDSSRTCQGQTAKGHSCTNRCLGSSSYCGMHGGNKKRKSVSSVSVTSKLIPLHDHSSVGSSCSVCEHHGDCLDSGVVSDSYVLP